MSEEDDGMGLVYLLVMFVFVAGTTFLAFICMKNNQGNIGSNIGKHNNARWGMDEGQERDWY